MTKITSIRMHREKEQRIEKLFLIHVNKDYKSITNDIILENWALK